MSPYEQLSRLLAGECTPEERAALLARTEGDPELREAWELLNGLPGPFEALLHSPPPPELDERILRLQRPPRARRRWAPLLLAAAAATLLWLGWDRRLPTELVIAEGTQRIEGRARALVGDVVIEIDGLAEIAVEPAGGPPRVTGGGEAMERKRTMSAAGLGALVTVAVYEGTATVRAGEAEPVELAAGGSTRVGIPHPPEAPPPSIEAQAPTGDLEAENRLLHQLLADQEAEHLGTPIPWPDDLPEALRPEAFERNVREAVASCAPDVEIVGFECSEPPCLALLRPTRDDWWDRLVNECPAWVDRYTSSVASGSGNATCPDGSEERYQVLGWSSHLIEPEGGFAKEDRANQGKRFMARLDEIVRSWSCEER